MTFKKVEFYYWNFMIFENGYTLKLLYEGFIRLWIFFFPIWIYMITSLLYFLNWEFMLWIADYYNELIFLKAFEIKVMIWVVLRDMYSYYELKVSSAFQKFLSWFNCRIERIIIGVHWPWTRRVEMILTMRKIDFDIDVEMNFGIFLDDFDELNCWKYYVLSLHILVQMSSRLWFNALIPCWCWKWLKCFKSKLGLGIHKLLMNYKLRYLFWSWW